MSRTVEAVYTEYAMALAAAELDLDTVSSRVRAGFEMAKRGAQERLPALALEYRSVIFSNARGFFPNGSPENVAKYVAISNKEVAGGVIVADANELYTKMAERIQLSMGASREFGSTQMVLLIEEIRQKSFDCGFPEPKSPEMTDIRRLDTLADLADYVRQLVRTTCSDSLNSSYIGYTVAQKALKAAMTGALPVVVINTTSADRIALAPSFAASKSFSVDEGEVDEEFVISKLKALGGRSESEPKPAPKSPGRPRKVVPAAPAE